MSGMIFAKWSLDIPTIAGVLLTFALATLHRLQYSRPPAMRIDPMDVLRAN